MASINGIELNFGSHKAPRSGGQFVLGWDESPLNNFMQLDGGWTVELRTGSLAVVANGGHETTFISARDESFGAIQRCFDNLSVRTIDNLTIVAPDFGHIVWWRDKRKSVVRIVAVSARRLTSKPIDLMDDSSSQGSASEVQT